MTTIRPAVPGDLGAVESLRRADGDALGFVPKQKYEHIVFRTRDRGRYRWEYERLYVAEDNGDLTGFVLAGLHRDGLKIEQVCVRRDARRMERALALVETVEREAMAAHLPRARCRVAFDLEANYFWVAAGWSPVGEVVSTWLNCRASQSRRPLIVYDKILCQERLF